MQILVLGMHRSGTSLTTRVINLMGAYVAQPDMLLEAQEDNAKGFWERKDVMRTNEELLKNQQCSWQNVSKWNDDTTTHPATAQQMQDIVSELSGNSPWVLKDPRMCITLPSWMPYLHNPIAVIASRHPLECARSLEMRNNIPLAHGLALWEYHTVGILRNAADMPKVFINYNNLLNSPIDESRRLCDELSEYCPALCLPDQQAITSFVTPSLKRAQAQDIGALSPCHQSLYDIICGNNQWKAITKISDESRRILETAHNAP